MAGTGEMLRSTLGVRGYASLCVLAARAEAALGRVIASEFQAAELAGDHSAGAPALAEALKLRATQVRDLLGDADQRLVLRLLGGQG